MSSLKNVLLVTNATTETEINLIKDSIVTVESPLIRIKLNLVHVIPTLPTCYFNIPSMVLLAERYYEEAKGSLTLIGNQLNVAQKDQWLITGRIRNEVLRLAHKIHAQFILASSTTIQDLQRSFLLNRKQCNTPMSSIQNMWAGLK